MTSHYRFRPLRQLFVMATAFAAGGVFGPDSTAQTMPQPTRYTFDIEPGTPLKDLLPTPSRTAPKLPPYLNVDLAQVTELGFGGPIASNSNTEKETAHIIAKINHLNLRDADGFVKALSANRADLRGLPFLMGKDCRTEAKQAQIFAESVEAVRRLIHNIAQQDPEAASVPNDELTAQIVYREFPGNLAEKDVKTQRGQASPADRARADVAGLMQMFASQPALYRVGLARYLATIDHTDATHALARLALFAPEESVQKAAIAGLKGRPAKDYASVLMQGFRYPLPAVSKRAADALVQLQAKDVRADLVAVLEQPDPRAPVKQKADGKEVTVVRELVRVNHRQNCLLCHAPANAADAPKGVLTVAVPLPSQPSESYYFRASPDIFVRTDVTYLRQDFSMMLPVLSTDPYRKTQRFDFLVRTRVLTEAEAAECARQIAEQGTPPSHLAALHALRELTGQTPAAPTPKEWRRLLNLTN